jgi:hypothetical protein
VNLERTVKMAVCAAMLLPWLLTACHATVSASAPPEEVVTDFYRWLLGYPGNPLVDRAYRASDRLAPFFVADVDRLLDGPSKGGFDPFLLAHNIPESIEVGDAQIVGNLAKVPTLQRYAGDPVMRLVEVELMAIDGAWKIVGVLDPSLALTLEPALAGLTPSEVVEAFYDWYLDTIGDPGSDEFRNPLVDRAYRSSKYLTGRLVHTIDLAIESGQPLSYDPFLCAQDIPRGLSVGDAALMGDTAIVEVYTSFARHRFRVELTAAEGSWQIDNVRCAVR